MREVVIQTLTREAFAPFGTYEQMDQPQGVALTGDLHAFYPIVCRRRPRDTFWAFPPSRSNARSVW